MKLVAQIEQYLLKQTSHVFPALPNFNDAETVHEMRVATRRLRVGLEFFAAGFEPSEYQQLLRQLARLGKALGVVRMCDVNRALLRRNAGATLQRERVARCKELVELCHVMMTAKIAARIAALVTHRHGKTDARRALEKLRRNLRRCLERFDKQRGRAAFHKLRIAARNYRYGLEIAKFIFSAKAGKQMKVIKKLQELMGACHDVEVLMEWLPEGELEKMFTKEYQRRSAAVQKFLDGGRRWVKKVKLDHE